MTWDGSKGGKLWKTKGEEDETWSFWKRIGKLEVLAVENHRLYLDIA